VGLLSFFTEMHPMEQTRTLGRFWALAGPLVRYQMSHRCGKREDACAAGLLVRLPSALSRRRIVVELFCFREFC
jgi:hypothetical protein